MKGVMWKWREHRRNRGMAGPGGERMNAVRKS